MRKLFFFFLVSGCLFLAGTLNAQARFFLLKGDSVYSAGNPGLAIEFYLNAITGTDSNRSISKFNKVYIFRRLGNCYMDINNLGLAKKYLAEGLELIKDEPESMSAALLYGDLAQFFFRSGETDSSFYYIKKQNKLALKLNSDSLLYSSDQAFAIYFSGRKEFERASEKYFSSLAIAHKAGLYKQLPEAFNNIGTFYFEQNKFKEALVFFDSSYQFAKKLDDKNNLWYSLYNLAETWYALKDFEKAYQWKMMYTELNARIMSNDNNSKIAEMQSKYELNEKERSLFKLKAANRVLQDRTEEKSEQLFFVFLICLLVFCGIGTVFYFYFRIRKKNKIILRQQQQTIQNTVLVNELNEKLARFSSQIDPEIFFRTIEHLKQECKSNFSSEQSMEIVSELAALMRSSLELGSKNKITLAEELSFLKKYFYLEKLNEKILKEAVFEFVGEEDSDAYELSPMLLQPLFYAIIAAVNRKTINEQLTFLFEIKKTQEVHFLECRAKELPLLLFQGGLQSDFYEKEKSFQAAHSRIRDEWKKAGKEVPAVNWLNGELVIIIPLTEIY
ncbi:MAG: histidine kinase [Bacteroidia bacterium]|nr:histidine kinase [Bacteroidia bacterium]